MFRIFDKDLKIVFLRRNPSINERENRRTRKIELMIVTRALWRLKFRILANLWFSRKRVFLIRECMFHEK